MSPAHCAAIVRRMARTSLTIVLELDEATDSPSGIARGPDGTAREFHGWLGLAEAIDSFARLPARGSRLDPGREIHEKGTQR